MFSKILRYGSPSRSGRRWRNYRSIANNLAFLHILAVFISFSCASVIIYTHLSDHLNAFSYKRIQEELDTVRAMLLEPNGRELLDNEIKSQLFESESHKVLIRLVDRHERIIKESVGMNTLFPVSLFTLSADDTRIQKMRLPGGKVYLLINGPFSEMNSPGQGGQIHIGKDISKEEMLVREILIFLVLLFLGIIVFAVISALYIVGKGLKPLSVVSEIIEQITEFNLKVHIDLAHLPVEMESLGNSFNIMFDRMESSFSKLTQYSENLAHELRTPVNNLMLLADIALSQERTPAEYQNVISSCVEEYERLSLLIDRLLFLARADNNQLTLSLERIDVRQELENIAEFYSETIGTFTVVSTPAPTITSITPSAVGRGATNVPFTITGSNFDPLATVTRSGTNVTLGTMTVQNSTTITGTIASVSGNGTSTITVTNPDTQTATSTLTLNTYPGTPTISPANGSVGQTMNVIVTSSSLVSGAAVSFSGTGITVNSTTFNSATQLTANITIDPAAAAGTRSVTVTNPDLGTRTASNIFTVSSVAVQSASPGIGAGGTGNITITGQGFAAGATVAITGGVTVNSVSVTDANNLVANVTVQSGATVGNYNVTVTVGAYSGTGTGIFTITAAPTITSLSPASLYQGDTNQNVTITGTNFVDGATVQFNGTGVTMNSATYVSATQISVNLSIDQNAVVGTQTLTVRNPDGGTATGGSFQIFVTKSTIPGMVTFKNVTKNSMALEISYTGDGNGDSSASVSYGITPALELGTVALTKATGVLKTSFSNLLSGSAGSGKLYFFRINISDADGVIGSSVFAATQPTKGSDLLHNSQNLFSAKWAQGWGIEGGKYGAFSCETCHNKLTTNAKLVIGSIQSPSMENWSSSGSTTLPISYNNSATDLGNDSAHATSTNVCEACHSRTNHHRYNNAAANHQGTTDCTPCHAHNEGFLPSCKGCHSAPQGPGGYRRQIVGNGGDFSNMSTHGKFTTLSSRTCTVCHDSSNHQSFNNGVSVALKNADTGAAVVYDGTPATAVATKDVCISCHDANGATDLGTNAMAPFGSSEDFRSPANINQYWPATGGAHSTNMICFNCHGSSKGADGSTTNPKYNAHASGNKHVLQDRAYDVVNPNNYCFNCHKGASIDPNKSFKNISGQMRLTYKHTTAKCFDCHGDENNSLDSMHALRAGSQSPGSGVIANNISNATGRAMTWAVTPWGGTSGSTSLPSNSASAEYQVCFKCHAANGTGTTPDVPAGTGAASLTNLALEFNPNNMSGHPVVTGLNNYPNSVAPKALTAAKMKAPWNVNLGTQVMTCSDCHATDSAASKGPHGSSVKWMLTGINKAWPYTAATANGTGSGTLFRMSSYNTNSGTVNGLFCLNCHTITGSNSWHTYVASSTHSSSDYMACANCHIRVPHGGKISRLLQTTNAPARFKSNGNGGTSNFTMWGSSTTNVKGSSGSVSSNTKTSCGTHSGASGGEAW